MLYKDTRIQWILNNVKLTRVLKKKKIKALFLLPLTHLSLGYYFLFLTIASAE